MGIIENSENVTIDIKLGDLMEKTIEKKSENWRIIQICCADDGEHFWLYYTFGDKFGFNMVTYRIAIEKDTKVQSITTIYPYAYLYENEMKELFGVNIDHIAVDYNNRLYRIKAVAPFRKEPKK